MIFLRLSFTNKKHNLKGKKRNHRMSRRTDGRMTMGTRKPHPVSLVVVQCMG
jgi:hypothetical protein